MRTAIQSRHHDHEEFHLAHQGMWFLLMLITLVMLLSKSVFAQADQWVIA